ncbi:MAG: hypothetical protein AB7M05_18185 [Alphaproteobacteria bacterium]
MSSLEKRAKLVLLPLLKCERALITSEKQNVLSTWAAKTVMTAEYLSKDKGVVRQEERAHLKENLSQPTGWNVWIAPYGGQNWRDLGLYQHVGDLDVPNLQNGTIEKHYLELTMLGLGKLLILVMNSSWPRLWGRLPMMTAPGLNRIYPRGPSALAWPTSLIYSDFEADRLRNFFARVAQQRV